MSEALVNWILGMRRVGTPMKDIVAALTKPDQTNTAATPPTEPEPNRPSSEARQQGEG